MYVWYVYGLLKIFFQATERYKYVRGNDIEHRINKIKNTCVFRVNYILT
jgi:hypothetical protein